VSSVLGKWIVAVALVRSRTGRQTNAIVRTAALGAAVLAEIRVRRGSSDRRFQIDEPDCGASPRRHALLVSGRLQEKGWLLDSRGLGWMSFVAGRGAAARCD